MFKGTEKVGDSEAYVIEATPANGKTETLYFDVKNGLLIRFDVNYQSSNGQSGIFTPMQFYFENYADVNGMMIPLTIRQIGSGITVTTRYLGVKYDVPLDDKMFMKPAK